jgi:Endosomal/lysosomal potassium channel TMEM175
VFSIAITLLVLDIAVPASAEGHLLSSIAHLWPSYLGYVISVATIGAMWLGHTATTDYLGTRRPRVRAHEPAAAPVRRVSPVPDQAVCRVHRQERSRAGRGLGLRGQPAADLTPAAAPVALRGQAPPSAAGCGRRGNRAGDQAADPGRERVCDADHRRAVHPGYRRRRVPRRGPVLYRPDQALLAPRAGTRQPGAQRSGDRPAGRARRTVLGRGGSVLEGGVEGDVDAGQGLADRTADLGALGQLDELGVV